MPKHHLTATGIQGLCAPTNYDESGQCHSGPSGAFKLSTLKACERRCAQCSACNFISFSAAQNDCSWYSECDLERVGTGGGAAVSSAMIASYQTYDMANLREQRRAALLAQSPRRPIVAPDFSSLEAACGPGYASRFSIAAEPDQVAWYANATWTFAQASSRASLQVCETGFNCGHSATTFLAQDPRVRVLTFDLMAWNFSAAARSVMKRAHGSSRFRLVPGNSLETIHRHFQQPSPSPSSSSSTTTPLCDVLHVDGGHGYVNALQDALDFIMHARCGALMLMDDTCDDPTSCERADPAAIGPTRAWAELRRLGLIRQTGRGRGSIRGRLWVSGLVQCREPPTRTPVEVRVAPGVASSKLSHAERRARQSFARADADQAAGHKWRWPH